MDNNGERIRRRAKVGHKKSRAGCQKCKTRRVKCDEKQPVCGNCDRLGLDCTWVGPRPFLPTPSPRPAAPSPSAGSSSGPGPARSEDGNTSLSSADYLAPLGPLRPPSPHHRVFAYFDSLEEVELPETRERRLMEHRLMQNYINNLARPATVSPGPEWQRLFMRIVPELALHHDNLLYAIMALSATQLLRTKGHDAELYAARQAYLIAAMREQRRMVDRLSIETADPVCLASLLIVMQATAMLRERPLEPYTPPLEWLHMGRGAGVLIWLSVAELRKAAKAQAEGEGEGKYEDDSGSKPKEISEYKLPAGAPGSAILIVANSHPRIGDDESYFDPSMRRDFEAVLGQKLPKSGDDWTDSETREAYEKALSYIGSIQHAIDCGEPVYAVVRRVQAFSLVMQPRFVKFLEARRPRALVVLAHFFAVLTQVKGVWWLGDSLGDGETTPKREIRAISSVLPQDWMQLMVWPMDQAGLA